MKALHACLLALAAAVAVAPAAASDRPPRPAPGIPPRAPGHPLDEADARQQTALQTLQKDSAVALVARFRGGQPRFVQGRIPVAGDGPAAMARAFVDRYGRDLWRLGPNSELRLLRTDPETGFLAVRPALPRPARAGRAGRSAGGRRRRTRRAGRAAPGGRPRHHAHHHGRREARAAWPPPAEPACWRRPSSSSTCGPAAASGPADRISPGPSPWPPTAPWSV